MREIDIYDFDKTLVPFDSGTKFTLFCLLRYPWTAVLLPFTAVLGLLCLAGFFGWGTFKKFCFLYVALIPKERAVKAFWDKYESSVFPWFKDRGRECVVISASPDFLLCEIQKRLGFEGLICSRHNEKTGAILGKNCRGEEKVSRFYQQYDKNEVKVVDVYSDSITHDRPLFELATGRRYHIINGEKTEFDMN